MSDTPAFWVDRSETERYGNYVRLATFEPWTDSDRAVELAVFAWDRATGPVMSPPYVRRHERILSAALARNDWDGGLIACVDVPQPGPRGFRAPVPADRLGRDGYWRHWPSEWRFSADRDAYYEPSGEDLSAGAYMLASVSLRFPVGADLPDPGDTGADAETCTEAVEILVEALNEFVTPVIKRIEGS
jgi:hypothetical protein